MIAATHSASSATAPSPTTPSPVIAISSVEGEVQIGSNNSIKPDQQIVKMASEETNNNNSSNSVTTNGNGKGNVVINNKPVMPSSIVTSPKSSMVAAASASTPASRGCNRCQKCSGYQAGGQEWRNVCTSCRCPRNCHDLLIGATCCGADRIGFDQIVIIGSSPGIAAPDDKAKADPANPNSTTGMISRGCRRKDQAESEGYSWIPHVSRKK